MAKVDKSQYTKEQWKVIREQRRLEKAVVPNIIPVAIANNKNDIAFVLGNGTSRSTIDLNQLHIYGKIYGCNALYREFTPDYLVAVDVKMVLEINESGYQHKHPVWTNPNKSYSKINNLNYFNPSKGWSSGPTALWLASQHNYKKIFILGFDYKGLNEGKTVNNIYADTKNYKKSTESATYYGNWLRQTTSILKENSKIHYYRVITPDIWVPQELNKFNNLSTIFVEDFKKMFNLS